MLRKTLYPSTSSTTIEVHYIEINPGQGQISMNDPKSACLAIDTRDRRCSAPADGEPRNRRILTRGDPKSAFPGAAVPPLPRSAQIWLAPRTTRYRRVCLREDLRSTLYGWFVRSASDRATAAGGHLRSTTDQRCRSKLTPDRRVARDQRNWRRYVLISMQIHCEPGSD